MKRIIVSLLFVATSLISNAQIRIKTPEQSLISTAFQDAFVVVTRSYVVRDKESGETYKREGRNDFNQVQSFGVRIKGGLIVPSIIDRPWEYDDIFSEYRDYYSGEGRRFTAEMPSGMVVVDSNLNINSCHKGNMLYTVTIDDASDGLTTVAIAGNVDGWIILWMKDNDTTTYLNTFREEIIFPSDKDTVQIAKPNNLSNMIGGIFVQPLHTSLGVIEFRLCGVVMDGGEKLVIAKPSIKNTPAKVVNEKSEQAGQDSKQRPEIKGLKLVQVKSGTKTDRESQKDKKKNKRK